MIAATCDDVFAATCDLLLRVTICFYVRECVACDWVSMCDNVLRIAAMRDDLLLL